MHSKGVIHADIKPLNIMRKGEQWMLIDLDAVCKISEDSVGFKSSSAYVPPEAVYVSDDCSFADIRSDESRSRYGKPCQVLLAHRHSMYGHLAVYCTNSLTKKFFHCSSVVKTTI